MPEAAEPPSVTVLDAFVFLDELALLAVLAISGASIDAPVPARIGLAVALVALAAVVWGRWLAPKAPHPLAHPQRVWAKVAVFAVAAIAFAATGHLIGAVVFLVISTALVVASERERRRLDR